MVGEVKNDTKETEEGFTEDDAAATIVMNDDSVEINVEELVAKIESTDEDPSDEKIEVRKRLDELREQQETEQNLDSTYNFNLDEDL